MKRVADDLEDISEVREDLSGVTESPREDIDYGYGIKSSQKQASIDKLRPTPKGIEEDDA